jgi:hypothetical protein
MRLLVACILVTMLPTISNTAVAQTAVVASEAKPRTEKAATSISISAFHDPVKAGSPVSVIVTLTNNSKEDIQLGRLLSGSDSKIDVRDSNGNPPPDTRFGYIHNGHVAQSDLDPSRVYVDDLKDSGVGVIVKAGQSTTWGIVVTRFYVMSLPGKYSIYIERADPADPKTILKSNTITVTVTP